MDRAGGCPDHRAGSAAFGNALAERDLFRIGLALTPVAGELRLLLIAVLVAVGTVTAISLFVDRLHHALLSESTSFLAADRIISSSRPIPGGYRQGAVNEGLAVSETMTFASMVFAEGTAEGRNQLVSVKAVGEAYPLRGTLRIGSFGQQRDFKAQASQSLLLALYLCMPSLGGLAFANLAAKRYRFSSLPFGQM